jgi:plasmid stabilization system protein ParE
LKIILLPQAKQDLDAIYEPVLGRIIRRIRLLEQFPEMGPAMMGPFTGYRSTVVAMFRIVYRILPRGVVEIAYVRHCRRAPPA